MILGLITFGNPMPHIREGAIKKNLNPPPTTGRPPPPNSQISVRKAQPKMTKEAMVAWLDECAKYFENRPTKGEDATHWSNIYNAENARTIRDYLK